MKKSNAYVFDGYVIAYFITAKLKSHQLNALVHVGAATNITFHHSNETVIKDLMEHVLLVKEYSQELLSPPSARVLKTILGADPDMSISVIDDNIVNYDRIAVNFPTSLLQPLLQEEMGVHVVEVLSEDYFEYRDGEVSAIHVITSDEVRELDCFNTENDGCLYAYLKGKCSIVDNDDLKSLFEQPLEGLGFFEVFLQTGPIEFRTDEIYLCFHEKKESHELMSSLMNISGEDNTFLNDFAYFTLDENRIQELGKSNYALVLAIPFEKIAKYVAKEFGITFEDYRFIESQCFFY